MTRSVLPPLTETPDGTATNESSLLETQIESLHKLYDEPKLTITVKGGGLPDEQTLIPEQALLITRNEVYCTLNRLRSALAFRQMFESGEWVMERKRAPQETER